MRYEVTRGIAWTPPKGKPRRAGAGDVLDAAKLKGADVEWLIEKGAIVPKPTKGDADGSR